MTPAMIEFLMDTTLDSDARAEALRLSKGDVYDYRRAERIMRLTTTHRAPLALVAEMMVNEDARRCGARNVGYVCDLPGGHAPGHSATDGVVRYVWGRN